MKKQVYILAHDQARVRALQAVGLAPDGMVVTIDEPRRNLEQSARFHAICTELGKSTVKWQGKTRNAAAWKVLMISGHAVATQQGAEMIPGLEGEFVNIRESSAEMSKTRISSLIDYCEAWLAQHAETA